MMNAMKNKSTITKNNESNSNQLNVNSLVINCTANNHNDIIKRNKYINIKDVNFNPHNKKSVETSLQDYEQSEFSEGSPNNSISKVNLVKKRKAKPRDISQDNYNKHYCSEKDDLNSYNLPKSRKNMPNQSIELANSIEKPIENDHVNKNLVHSQGFLTRRIANVFKVINHQAKIKDIKEPKQFNRSKTLDKNLGKNLKIKN